MRKKLTRPVPADCWRSINTHITTKCSWRADQCPKADCDCYIVPRALWERAEKALRKKGKK